MSETKRLARQLERALQGGAWYGPSWKEALEGVTRDDAMQRPIPAGHTIAEIVLHATTWHDVVRRRLEGEMPEVSDAEDWPAATIADERAWSALVTRLLATGSALRDTVERFPAERLTEKRPGLEDTWSDLILGELEHVLYHLGQVGILRKAAVAAAAPR